MNIFSFLFFFSSRRRHTRWPRDWSSDVCSSDLSAQGQAQAHRRAGDERYGGDRRHVGGAGGRAARSEERRVGKECRCRWGGEHEKKKEDGGGRETECLDRRS